MPPAPPRTPPPLPAPRGRLDLNLQKILPGWRPKDSREIEPARTDGPFINIIPLDNWQEIALLAGTYGGLALWVMRSRSRKGLMAAGARMHRVRGYIAPRMKGVSYDAEVYFPWDSTAMSHQGRVERSSRARIAPRAGIGDSSQQKATGKIKGGPSLET